MMVRPSKPRMHGGDVERFRYFPGHRGMRIPGSATASSWPPSVWFFFRDSLKPFIIGVVDIETRRGLVRCLTTQADSRVHPAVRRQASLGRRQAPTEGFRASSRDRWPSSTTADGNKHGRKDKIRSRTSSYKKEASEGLNETLAGMC